MFRNRDLIDVFMSSIQYKEDGNRKQCSLTTSVEYVHRKVSDLIPKENKMQCAAEGEEDRRNKLGVRDVEREMVSEPRAHSS